MIKILLYTNTFMRKIIENNRNYILNKEVYKTSNETLKRIIKSLNEKSLVIVSWLKNVWKTNILKDLLTRTSTTESFFYVNKILDKENKITNNKDLENLLKIHIDTYKQPKIIILHNTNKIERIKNFISKLYKEKKKDGKSQYKIILVWNNIKIEWIEDIEISPKNTSEVLKNKWLEIDNILKYGSLEKIISLPIENSNTKKEYINFIKNDILLNDIFISFSVKNIELYNYTLSFLSKNNIFLSLRELQKKLDVNKSISLKTTMDYIDFSIQSKIIRKMYKYDLKLNKYISSRVKYYFTDLWIRNSFYNFLVDTNTLKENLIFNELYSLWYEIYGWLNGKFDFSFIAEKNWERIYIHLSEQTDKEEIKKEVRKLNKIWDENGKYLIVENIKELWLKKLKYENVEIFNLEDFIKRI